MLSCSRKRLSSNSLPLCCGFYYNFLFPYALMLSQKTFVKFLTIMLRILLQLFISLCSYALTKDFGQIPYHYDHRFTPTFYFLMLSCSRRISLTLYLLFHYGYGKSFLRVSIHKETKLTSKLIFKYLKV